MLQSGVEKLTIGTKELFSSEEQDCNSGDWKKDSKRGM